MSGTLDIGSLIWVHDEIELALHQAAEQLNVYEQDHNNLSALRHALTHLNQVNGALDMVGLAGCKCFCFEIETVIAALEKQTLSTSSYVLNTLQQALLQLEHYLQALLNGAPDQSLQFYQSLLKLAAFRGETVEPSLLFFPDINRTMPKQSQREIGGELGVSEASSHTFFNEQRSFFQRALVSWLKVPHASSLQAMRSALVPLQASNIQNSQKTFLWVVMAFLELLEHTDSQEENIAQQPRIKTIFRRVDQQLGALASGHPRAHQTLMKDILYFIAIAQVNTPLVAEVQACFELDQLIPKATPQDDAQVANEQLISADQSNASVLEPMLQELEALKSSWTAVAEASHGEFAQFLKQSQSLLNFADQLGNQAFIKLAVALNVFAQVWDESGLSPTEDALVEVAAGLVLLEDALREHQHMNHDVQQHLITQAQRIKNISDSVMGDDAKLVSSHHGLAEDTLLALAFPIKAALNTCEQILDGFFRNPEQVEVLANLEAPIKQMIAAFDVLNMPVPMQLLTLSQQMINVFKTNAASTLQFESLADGLSLLGMFVEELPPLNANRLQALETALVKLTSALQGSQSSQLQVEEVRLDEVQAAPAWVLPQKSAETQQDVLVDTEMQDVFLQESEEVLAVIAESIQALRINITANKPLADLRRSFHTLKGSGRMVGLNALGELAWMVENLLNQIIDKNIVPDIQVIDFTEAVSVAIGSHLASLKQESFVSVDLTRWQSSLADLTSALQAKQEVPKVEEILIGGTHKMSKALFDIFIEEAQQHLQVLKTVQATLQSERIDLHAVDSVRRAAHTLASNAGAAGFKVIEELSRNLELWLDLDIDWTEPAIKRFSACVNSLGRMLDNVKNLRQPKPVLRLVKDLKQAITSASHLGDNKVGNAQANASVEQVDSDLLAMFADEANDLLMQSGTALRSWQGEPSAKHYAEDLQRLLHTLKGSARMAAQTELGDEVHAMEDLLLLSLGAAPAQIAFEALFDRLDSIAVSIEAALRPAIADTAKNTEIEMHMPALSAEDTKHEANSQQVRMRADVLDRLINDAGEISIARSRMEQEVQNFKQYFVDLTESLTRLKAQLREMEIEAESTLQSRLAHLQEAHESFDPLEFDRFTRLQELTRLMAESVNDVSTVQQSLSQNIDETETSLLQQSRINRELQYALINIRMVPFSTISDRLHRLVRQTARELGKRVELVIDGEHVDIDRSVLEHISGALEHLLRNAVAHGVESAEVRKKARKQALGNISIKVRRENDEITIHVSDDGAGIDLEEVRKKAQAQGRISADQSLSEQALLGLIFELGFSTAAAVTQIAGRGVGLDSVRTDVTALGGRINVANNEGAGASFSIYLPLTLSLAQVVIARVGAVKFALPAVMVEQVQKVKTLVLDTAIETGQFESNGRHYPLHYLGHLVGVEYVAESPIYTPVILLRSGQYSLALQVDEVFSNQELVMKPVGAQLARVPGVVGASVLGDGQIIYILNPIQIAHCEDLLAGSIRISHTRSQDSRPYVMVVDDSLTMRKVLSRLLEREGYRVITAIHGVDALQILQEIKPSIILTDIEMPHMDGFELVRQLRNDAATAETPIIMISSRTAEKHQSLAKTLGVNEFMGKPIQDDALISLIASLIG